MSTRQDCDVEKDCSAVGKAVITWTSCGELADLLASREEKFLLLDMRSYSVYSTMHIKTAHSLSFSSMLIRRINRGTIALDSLVTDQSLLERMGKASQVIIYDSNSMPLNARNELHAFSDMLLARFGSNFQLKALIGGMDAFESHYPSLCTDKTSVTSPSRITLDTASIQRTVPEKSGTPKAVPAEILPHLYLGSAKDAAQLSALNVMGITAVLNITTHCPNLFSEHFEYMSIAVEDTHDSDLLSRLQQAIAFIDGIKKKGGRVFVHCHAGISRSATVCIAYMMQTQRMTLQEAYEHVRGRRPIISPNLHFMGQLTVFQRELTHKWATEVPLSGEDVVTTTQPIQTSPCYTTHPLSSLSVESKHPLFNETSRSASVPLGLANTVTTNTTIDTTITSTTKSRSRERLTLSLNSGERRKNAPRRHPNSPCRLEAQTLNHSQSLSLSTTCT